MKPLILDLFPYIRHSWSRKVERQGSLHGANLAMVTGVGALGFFIQLCICLIALALLVKGKTDGGNLALIAGLNTLLAGWLITPLMVNSAFDKGRGLEPTRLGQFPLSLRQLYLTGLAGNLVQPVYWFLVASSLLVLVPLSQVAFPLYGIIAGLLYIFLCLQISISMGLVGQAVLSSRYGREAMLLTVAMLSIPFFFLAFADYNFADSKLFVTLFGNTYLVSNAAGTEGILAGLKVFSPADMVLKAANNLTTWLWMLILAVAAMLAYGLSMWSLRRIIMRPPATLVNARSQLKSIKSPFWVTSSIGPLVTKEIRYLSRTMDHIVGLVVAVVAFFFAVFKPEFAQMVLPGAACLVVVDAAAMPFNVFGLDGAAADRYRLLPLTGRQVLLSKNLAYFFIIFTHVAPMVLAAFIRTSVWFGIDLTATIVAMVLITTAYGNFVSIKSPAPRAFFNFDSKEQVGGVLSLLFALVIWLAPVFVWLGLRIFSEIAATSGLLLLMGVAYLIYRYTLKQAAELFEQSAETMRVRLEK